MSPARLLMMLGLLGAASGCGMPPYQHEADPAHSSALLNLGNTSPKWMCVRGERERLYADAGGYAAIPAAGRLTVGTLHTTQHYKCISATSFIPQPGQRYRIDFERVKERCISRVFGEDPAAVSGLRLETSEQAAYDCTH